jgi:hypothetical protein
MPNNSFQCCYLIADMGVNHFGVLCKQSTALTLTECSLWPPLAPPGPLTAALTRCRSTQQQVDPCQGRIQVLDGGSVVQHELVKGDARQPSHPAQVVGVFGLPLHACGQSQGVKNKFKLVTTQNAKVSTILVAIHSYRLTESCNSETDSPGYVGMCTMLH